MEVVSLSQPLAGSGPSHVNHKKVERARLVRAECRSLPVRTPDGKSRAGVEGELGQGARRDLVHPEIGHRLLDGHEHSPAIGRQMRRRIRSRRGSEWRRRSSAIDGGERTLVGFEETGYVDGDAGP